MAIWHVSGEQVLETNIRSDVKQQMFSNIVKYLVLDYGNNAIWNSNLRHLRLVNVVLINKND